MELNKQEWNQTIKQHGGSFLQSWEWGVLQERYGKRVSRIARNDFIAQGVHEPLPFGKERLYIPRGPVVQSKTTPSVFWKEVHAHTTHDTIFVEIDIPKSTSWLAPNTKRARQPHKTLVLNLTKEKDELYENFHKDLRYSIRRAKKREVRVERSGSIDDLYTLLVETAKRHNFRIWDRAYYALLWEVFSAADMAEIWEARADGKLLSTTLFILFGGRVTYLYAASDYRHRAYMGPHMLHWQALQSFKERGYAEYDLWGIDEDKMPGVTRFKKRFGGRVQSYPGIHRRILHPTWYGAYKLGQTIMRPTTR